MDNILTDNDKIDILQTFDHEGWDYIESAHDTLERLATDVISKRYEREGKNNEKD